MKKIIAVVLAVSSLFFLTATKVLAEWSAGVSTSVGHFKATGQENEDGEINKATAEEAQFSYPSLFVEYNIGGVSFGFDVIPGSVTTEEQARTDYNVGDSAGVGNDGAGAAITNTAQVKISQHVSLYALVPIMDTGAFVRAAIMRADVNTKETLNTGSTYPDTNMLGGSLSLGYQYDTGAGFFRAEVGASEYDNIEVTSSNSHKINADVSGQWARISIGKSF